jgi:hypothetical protein
MKHSTGIHCFALLLEKLDLPFPGSSASREAFGRPINRFSSSEQSLKLSRDWLHSCLMTHDICPKPNGKFMPTRLIAISNVGSSDYLILLECSDPEPYAALSYCWGNKKQVTTTSTNLQRHKSFLSFKDLPATVKDAITVVSKMGIRRLWIDCLCIIQDDDDDKAREIAKMPLIYSQATVTIAASNSKSVHEGFLRDRTPRQYFQLPYLCLDGKAGSVTLRRGKYEEHKQPLESRGWAFQERLLSPRILDYRSHHTEWVCHENKGARRLTDGNFEFTLSPLFSDDFEIFSDALLKGDTPSGKSTSSSEGKDNIDKYFQLWYKLVTTYTLRQLTIPSDRILAISAIANRFQPLLNDKYCAGHWKSRLDKELLWRVPFQESGLKQRPSEYQAPSWSWASISAPIDTELFAGETRLDKRREQRDDCFKILDCQIQLRSEEESNKSTEVHQFGAVISGALVAIGRVQQGELVWPGDKVRKYDQNGESGGATLKSTWVWRDAIEEELAKVHGFIPIFLLRVAQSPFHTALILRQKGPSVYSRLGIVNFTFENIPPRFSFGPGGRDVFQEELRWLDAGEVRTITIV